MTINADTTTTPLYPVMGLLHRKDAKPLTPEQIRFEIDMCIGCDRCMLACVALSAIGLHLSWLALHVLGTRFHL